MQFITVSTVNFQTFSELAFKFTLTGRIVMQAMAFSLVMGLIGGLLPAVRAARLPIASALRSRADRRSAICRATRSSGTTRKLSPASGTEVPNVNALPAGLTLEDFDAYWIPRGWSKEGPVKTQSRIDVPKSGSGRISATSPSMMTVSSTALATPVTSAPR